jgi:hypothetical protein
VEIRIEAESDSSAALFCVCLDGRPIEEQLTAVQAHLLVGELLERAELVAFLKPAPQIKGVAAKPKRAKRLVDRLNALDRATRQSP